jgi:lipopolysaccharide transport system ATP-binding protein
MKAIIRVDNLGKCYRIGAKREPYGTFRETLARAATYPLRRLRRQVQPSTESLWALKGISFTVAPGEVVGVIGRNGAGKSTLLKVLARITEPTTGRVELRGRVASLLEVGTGFHPELSGRENVYLNGAILGMTRREIQRKFDAIVAFAEVEPFLETPVKHYSTGMYVRLAFAVAAHLDPEILVVDEVLAVGDTTYQQRCISRMAEIARGGKTILFVSHNMDLIPKLCQTAIWLDKGVKKTEGASQDVIDRYIHEYTSAAGEEELQPAERQGDGRARFVRLQVLDSSGHSRNYHVSGEDLTLRMEIEAGERIKDVALAVILKSLAGARLVTGWTREVNYPVDLTPGRQAFQCTFHHLAFRPGHSFTLMLWMEAGTVIDSIEDARVLEVVDPRNTVQLAAAPSQGIVLCAYEWSRC